MSATGLFAPMKHQYLADMISLSSISAAKLSCKKLRQEFNGAVTRAKRLRIARATMLAANRALVMARRDTLSAALRYSFRQISTLYRKLAVRLFDSYGRSH